MSKPPSTKRISITVAARRTGVDPEVAVHCVELGFVREPLTEDELAELRRVRRLLDLGINLPGIEVILRMRRRIETLQIEMERLSETYERPSTR